MIKITNLHKIYNKGKRSEHYALKDVNLEIGNTGLVCILGESGSGKTTLLNTIGGLDTYTEGSIEVDEKEDYGYIFQNYYLLNDYTVAYNVKLALNRYQLTEEEKDARVEYVLDMLGIGKYKKKLVSKLSGGQKQRVSIARALVKSPSIIFADEPTGNLDEENTIRTMSILKSISKNCLVLLVSHEKRIANFFADRIIEVADGKIKRDYIPDSKDAYTRSDDSNIYLKEYENRTLEDAFGRFQLYYKEQPAQPVSLNIAMRDGKIYIQNLSNCDIVLAGEESGVELIDDLPPVFDMDDVDKLSYQLEKMQDKGSAKLSWGQIRKLAFENLKILGKKQSYVIGIFLVAAILLTITLAQFVSTKAVDEDKVVTSDSRYLEVKFEKVTSVRGDENQLKILEFADKYMSDQKVGDVLYVPGQNLYLRAKGVAQMENLTQIVNNFTFAPIQKLDKSQLVLGTMPKNRNEVVIDQRVLKQIMNSKRVVAAMYDSMEDYLGIEFCILTHDTTLKIVGVCDSGQPDIYASENVLLGLEAKGYNVASVDEYEAISGEKISLKEDEIYLREGLFYAKYGAFSEGNIITHGFDSDVVEPKKVVGLIPDEYGINYVGTDSFCKHLRNIMIYHDKKAVIYTDDMEQTIELLNEYAKEYNKAFRLVFTKVREEQIATYLENSTVDFGAVNLISILTVLLSLIMVFFTMKSNVVARMEELTVYRLLGISKGSIIKSYLLEMGVLTSLTSLPAVLLTTGIIKMISTLPSLQMALYFPVWVSLVLIVVIYLLHSIISILPVYGLLTKPPATLALKG